MMSALPGEHPRAAPPRARGEHPTMFVRRTAVRACAVLLAAAAFARAETIYDFTYVSTRNAAHNDKSHLLNTGIYLYPGEILQIVGSGQIHVGGPYYVWSNFDMGLVSPIYAPELIRGYRGDGANYTVAPIPLAGETVLFKQDRVNLNDNHDLSILVTSQSEGWFYLGMFDNYYEDNTGRHDFRITVTPEPVACALALLTFVLIRPRRRLRP